VSQGRSHDAPVGVAGVGEDRRYDAPMTEPTSTNPSSAISPEAPLPAREGYNRWAEVYDADGNPLIALERPELDRLVGDVRGQRIVDIGCGTGRHTARLALAGAHVLGLDQSPGMLARARQKVVAGGVTERVVLIEHDVRRGLPLADGSVDLALCCLVLDHIADLVGFFREMRRVVKPGGPLVLSSMHPAMMLRGVQARFIDPATGERVLVESSPNRMCDYIMAIVAAGLQIEHISEHAVDADLAARLPRAEPYLNWPILLMLKLRR